MTENGNTGGTPERDATIDSLLDGRIRLAQPAQGYRVAIDPVFLAATIPAQTGETVLDLGCGVGAASLCLAARVADCRIYGVDADRKLVRLAGDNVIRNGFGSRILILAGDILRPPQRLEPGSFSHVMANPPYLQAGAATPSPVETKARANVEGEADLAAWIRYALTMAQNKGTITFIHRADRLEALMALLAGRAGEMVVFPLWAGAGKDARRVIVQARKGVAAPTRLAPGLVLHGPDGRYTDAAQMVLRRGIALPIGVPAP